MARDYAKEYRDYHGKPDQVKRRSSRNKARRKMVRDGKAKQGDGREVDHKDGNPLNNRPSNLRVVSQRTNRVKKSEYQQALKLYPIAKAYVARAQSDAPDYRPASDVNRCANCAHFDGQECSEFDFTADPDYICNDFAAQEPEIGELRALLERAGARHNSGDNRMLQDIHDLAVRLGAMCQ